jgi:glycosyltransferase involved in cell wall biosynthesis
VTWHLVTPELAPRIGGIASWSERVARGLVAAGEDVRVYARAPAAIQGVPVEALWGRSWARWGGLWTRLQVGPAIQPGDVLLCATWEMAHGPFGGLLARARALGVPVIVAWHGSDLTAPAVRAGREEVARAAIHAAVSRFLAGELARAHGVSAAVLPAPVDLAAPVRRGPAWLVVARLVPGKAVEEALRWASLRGRDVTVVGEGPCRAALESLAARLPVRVSFLGAMPFARIPWEGHEAVLLAGHPEAPPEGLGLVLLEGSARGLAAIGSDRGGIPEVAAHIVAWGAAPPEVLEAPEIARARVEHAHGVARCVEGLRRLAAGSC